jgi:hypothetical protein
MKKNNFMMNSTFHNYPIQNKYSYHKDKLKIKIIICYKKMKIKLLWINNNKILLVI